MQRQVATVARIVKSQAAADWLQRKYVFMNYESEGNRKISSCHLIIVFAVGRWIRGQVWVCQQLQLSLGQSKVQCDAVRDKIELSAAAASHEVQQQSPVCHEGQVLIAPIDVCGRNSEIQNELSGWKLNLQQIPKPKGPGEFFRTSTGCPFCWKDFHESPLISFDSIMCDEYRYQMPEKSTRFTPVRFSSPS